MNNPVRLVFDLNIAPMGKERPRVTERSTFMPKKYVVWREVVRRQIRSQVPSWATKLLPLTCPLSWQVGYWAPKGIIGPDGDNADGALWDALQTPSKGGWGLIVNDKQFKRWGGAIFAGPTRIRIQIQEMLP